MGSLIKFLKQYPLKRGFFYLMNKEQSTWSANKQPNKRTKKGKLKLGIIKG